jgi:hypothetical protein
MHVRVALAAAIVAAIPGIADASAFRRVEMTFVLRGNVVSQPGVIVGGDTCSTFSSGIADQPPTVLIEYCTLADEQLRVSWTVRDGDRVLSHSAVGLYEDGSTFDAGIPGVTDVRVVVGGD